MKLMVIGFPKSGTTTITNALAASGMRPAHWQVDDGRYVGALIYAGAFYDQDPFAQLSGYDAVTQADVCLPLRGYNFWPNLDFPLLRAIRRTHPECLLLLNYRRPEAICDSIERWPSLHRRLFVSEVPGLPKGIGKERSQLMTWIENHFDAARTYFAGDPNFLEIDIESADAPEILGRRLGIEIKGWGDYKPSSRNPRPEAAARHA